MTVSLRGLPACNTEACGYRDLRTILLSWSGSHRAASIWRTRRARGIAAMARDEATVYGIVGLHADYGRQYRSAHPKARQTKK